MSQVLKWETHSPSHPKTHCLHKEPHPYCCVCVCVFVFPRTERDLQVGPLRLEMCKYVKCLFLLLLYFFLFNPYDVEGGFQRVTPESTGNY